MPQLHCPYCRAPVPSVPGLTPCPSCGKRFVISAPMQLPAFPPLVQILTAACPRCGKKVENSPEVAGFFVACASCGQNFQMPATSVPIAHPPVPSTTPPKPPGFWETMNKIADDIKAAGDMQRDYPVVYVSGPFGLTGNSPGTLILGDNGMEFRSAVLGRPLFNVPYHTITEAMVDTAERMTLMRVLVLGIFALGFKKQERFLKMATHDETGLSALIIFGKTPFGTDMDTLGGKILDRRRMAVERRQKESSRANSTQPSPATGLTSTLEAIASLRDKGILTEEEFQKKKSEILSRL